jgi:hypothetical protein
MTPTKKPTIEIEELLRVPYDEKPENPIPDFSMKEGEAIPLFTEQAMFELQEFHLLSRELMRTEDIVVFWGLSGLLQNFYSTIPFKEDSLVSMDTVETQVRLAKVNQVFNLYRSSGFEIALEKLGDLETLKEIPYEEALLVLEGRKQAPGPSYEEPEESEFDENCLSTCTPGDHKCGKK